MNDSTIIYDLALERINRLHAISLTQERKMNDKNYDIEMEAFYDGSKANEDNMSSTMELAGYKEEVKECHFKYCVKANRSFCVCFLKEENL